jgi:hypothetical protein
MPATTYGRDLQPIIPRTVLRGPDAEAGGLTKQENIVRKRMQKK